MHYKIFKPIVAMLVCIIAAAALAPSCRRGDKEWLGSKDVLLDSLAYARGFNISYYDGFTRVCLRDPWDTLSIRKEYYLADKALLRQRPLLADSLSKRGILIGTPVQKAVIYTSVHTAMAEQMGLLERVCGVCEPEYITSDEVRKRIENGQIADLGQSSSPNIEKIIDLGAEVIIASPFENSGYGAAEKLGIPIVEAADYMENHPLGRTEWVKFYGLLFGCRQRADSLFSDTVQRYLRLKELAASVKTHPTFILERKWGQTWAVPSDGSYVGCMHRDAGASYIFSSLRGSASVHMNFEQVFDRGKDADFWFMKYSSKGDMSYKDLQREYQPYANFKAYKDLNIYGCNTLVTTYYDDITLHPDRILADLIYIYHPELMPDHTLVYYFPLREEPTL